MAEFKVGDKVIYTNGRYQSEYNLTGKTGTIRHIHRAKIDDKIMFYFGITWDDISIPSLVSEQQFSSWRFTHVTICEND